VRDDPLRPQRPIFLNLRALLIEVVAPEGVVLDAVFLLHLVDHFLHRQFAK
jgi:hypothetical protein